jgi:hypothetical protein
MRKRDKRTKTKKLISPLGKYPLPPYRHLHEAAQANSTATTKTATGKMNIKAHLFNLHARENDS